MDAGLEIVSAAELPTMTELKTIKGFDAFYTLKDRESGRVLSYADGSGNNAFPCVFTKKQVDAIKKALDQLSQDVESD